MSYQEKKKLLIYSIRIKENSNDGWNKKYIRVFKNVFEYEDCANKLMENKNIGIIEDFKFNPINLNEYMVTLNDFIKHCGDISISDFITLLKALED